MRLTVVSLVVLKHNFFFVVVVENLVKNFLHQVQHLTSTYDIIVVLFINFFAPSNFAFQAQNLFALFEHAVGYGLFQVKEFDELALLAPRVEQSVLDLGKFNSLVKTIAFAPFKSGHNALDNMNSISEGL